jgi:DNA-binding beta-propeller fold protein YncE
MTLAISGRSAWVACKEQARLVQLALPGGNRTASLQLDAPVSAVATGLGAVWALDTGSTLYRIDPRTARVRQRIPLNAAAAYNIWVGGGSVWVADDQDARVLRISAATNKVVARVRVSDGPADMAFASGRAWVIDHRDNMLFRLDLATNRATRLGAVAGNDAAAERVALFDGSLWITGRGVSLLEIDPDSGAVTRSLDVGGTGIDVVAAAGALWIPVRSAAVDRTGFPTMTGVRRITAGGDVTTAATATGRVDVHGLAAGLGSVWLADNTAGLLYRLRT